MSSLPSWIRLTGLALLPLLAGAPMAAGAAAQSANPHRAEKTVSTAQARKQAAAKRSAQIARIRQRANRVAGASNRLGGEMLASLVGPNGDKGAFISPHGIASALNLLSFGAAGGSRIALQSKLDPTQMGETARALALRYLGRSLNAANTSDVQIASANALWLRSGLAVLPKFQRTARFAFAAEIASVDFDNPATLASINKWSNAKTKTLIPQILSELDPKSEMVLTNATYFKGKWTTAFAAELTEPKPFMRPDGTTRSVAMMATRQTARYASVGDYHAVALPYRGNRFQMVIVTARDPSKSSAVWRQLAEQGIDRTLAGLKFSNAEVDVSLPRFRAEFATELQPVLAGLGFGNALEGNLDYSRLANAQLASLRVVHRAAIDVNEAGTEAAAVTAIVGSRSIEAAPIEFNADRPFLTAIVDRRTNALLFLGYIIDP